MAWVGSCVKSCSSAYNNNEWISSWICYISIRNIETMPRKLALQTCLTRKKHLLWAQYKNHTDLGQLDMFLCISLITTRNFNGSNPDDSLVLANAYWAICLATATCQTRTDILYRQYRSCWWPGGGGSQGSSIHGINLVLSKYYIPQGCAYGEYERKVTPVHWQWSSNNWEIPRIH